MSDPCRKGFFSNCLKVGTPECAVFSAVIAMVLGLLLLFIGFWNTVLIAAFMLVGGIIGGVSDKKQAFKNLINRLFPARSTVPYREQNPDILRAVRKATEEVSKEELREPAEEEKQE